MPLIILLQTMLAKASLSKTASLPALKVNLQKYDHFFTKKDFARQLAMEQDPQNTQQSMSTMQLRRYNRAHQKNLQVIDKKSTIKSKVEAFLTDSHKMGILDHTKNQTSNRRSLTKISLEGMKPVRTEVEQQLIYLKKIKSQLNFCCQKNTRMEKQIKNTVGITSQVKQKIIFFQDLLSQSSKERRQLLDQRENNIKYIRFETDRLRFMQQSLKEINITMKKRVKDAQNQLKKSSDEAKIMNDIESIRQAQLDKKEYLLKSYEKFEFHKSENMFYDTQKAVHNLTSNQASNVLKRHQQSINILPRQDYDNECCEFAHEKYTRQIVIQQFYKKMLDSVWTKYSSYYQSYEKAEQMIKMHCRDRQELVQDSYKKCFEVKDELNQKILDKQKKLQEIQEKNKMLKNQIASQCYDQVDDIEKRLSSIMLDYRTGKKQMKVAKNNEQKEFEKQIYHREEEVERCKAQLTKLRQWTLRQEQKLDLTVSKKASLADHLLAVVKNLHEELKSRQQTIVFPQVYQAPQPSTSKTNKYGNLKKKR